MMISGYHIHVYSTPEQYDIAQEIRSKLLRDLPNVDGAGPVRKRPIGPHPLPMFEAWFRPEVICDVLPWLLQNRRGLVVLIHPLTGDDLADHTQNAVWIGGPLELDLSVLKD